MTSTDRLPGRLARALDLAAALWAIAVVVGFAVTHARAYRSALRALLP